jgi:holo-[acyl-carrier protein] synthase
MILGIGTDIIEIFRIEKLIKNTNFMGKFFTESERLYLEKKGPESTAGYFSAKEAVVKAIGTGFSGFKFTDVEIIKKNSVPHVELHGKAKNIANERGIEKIHVSISHCKSYATAVAVAEGKL